MTAQDQKDDTWKDRAAELLRLGLEELDNERYESAAQMLLDSLTVYEAHRDEEGSLSVATYLGFALYEQGQHERAVSVWEEILRRGTSLPTVYALLAKHYRRLGQEEEVQRIFEALRKAGEQQPVPVSLEERQPTGHAEGDASGTPVPSASGSPRILVADDEESIRKLMEHILTDWGYEVELACDGEDALLAILLAQNARRGYRHTRHRDLRVRERLVRSGWPGIGGRVPAEADRPRGPRECGEVYAFGSTAGSLGREPISGNRIPASLEPSPRRHTLSLGRPW